VLKNLIDMILLDLIKKKHAFNIQSQNSIYSLINIGYKVLFLICLNKLVYVKSNSRLYERRKLLNSNNQ